MDSISEIRMYTDEQMDIYGQSRKEVGGGGNGRRGPFLSLNGASHDSIKIGCIS